MSSAPTKFDRAAPDKLDETARWLVPLGLRVEKRADGRMRVVPTEGLGDIEEDLNMLAHVAELTGHNLRGDFARTPREGGERTIDVGKTGSLYGSLLEHAHLLFALTYETFGRHSPARETAANPRRLLRDVFSGEPFVFDLQQIMRGTKLDGDPLLEDR